MAFPILDKLLLSGNCFTILQYQLEQEQQQVQSAVECWVTHVDCSLACKINFPLRWKKPLKIGGEGKIERKKNL